MGESWIINELEKLLYSFPYNFIFVFFSCCYFGTLTHFSLVCAGFHVIFYILLWTLLVCFCYSNGMEFGYFGSVIYWNHIVLHVFHKFVESCRVICVDRTVLEVPPIMKGINTYCFQNQKPWILTCPATHLTLRRLVYVKLFIPRGHKWLWFLNIQCLYFILNGLLLSVYHLHYVSMYNWTSLENT